MTDGAPSGQPSPPSDDVGSPASSVVEALDLDAPDRLRSVLQLVGSVVAPTALLTALLIYFGSNYAFWFFRHFGIESSLAGLTTQDHVMLSVNALFLPIVVLLSVGLVVLWFHATLTARLFAGAERRGRERTVGVILTGAGLVLFFVGLAAVFVPRYRATHHLAYPLSLGGGALLLWYGARLQRRARLGRKAAGVQAIALLEGTGAFLLVALSLFWAATNYAAEVGEKRARQYERAIEFDLPKATLYAKEPLNLDAPSVEQFVCAESESGFRFRYEGLRLMLRAGGKLFFLHDDWSQADGVTVVIPESDAVRLELSRADAREREATEPRC